MDVIESTMRVLTWNIWWRFGQWEQRQTAIIDTLRNIDPDVVALQEVWDDGSANQAELLASELGMHVVYDGRMMIDGVGFGNAILSRWPISSTDTLSYQTPGETQEDRVAVRATVDGPRGSFEIVSTHLNWRPGHSGVRQVQVEQLCGFVADSTMNRYPAIVCGDFNAEPTSDEIRMLTGRTAVPVDDLVFVDAWEAGHGVGTGATWSSACMFSEPGPVPDRRIDYILAGLPGQDGAGHVKRCSVVADEPVGGVWPSDHFAVMAELRY